MANVQHSTLASADVHEPKYMTSATTADTGKVLTPSSTTNSVCELRNLLETEIDEVVDVYTCYLADVSTASSTYFVPNFPGTITKIQTVLHGAIATADAALTAYVAATPITTGTITVAYSGSAAGDVDSTTPTGANTITASQAFRIATDGASTNTVPLTISVSVKRS